MTAPVREADRLARQTAPTWIEVVQATSSADRMEAMEIRRRVFAEEQHVADLRVSDPDDPRSLIALASLRSWGEGGAALRWPVATGRLTFAPAPGGQALVAWVATLPEARGQGAGGAVMRFLLDAADDAGVREVVLAAQAPAERFYHRLGFTAAGALYDVRGIPHRRMIRRRPA